MNQFSKDALQSLLAQKTLEHLEEERMRIASEILEETQILETAEETIDEAERRVLPSQVMKRREARRAMSDAEKQRKLYTVKNQIMYAMKTRNKSLLKNAHAALHALGFTLRQIGLGR